MNIPAIAEIKEFQRALRSLEKACANAEKIFADADRRRLDDLEKATAALEVALGALGDETRLTETRAYCSALAKVVAQARAERSDVDHRRKQLASAAVAVGWPLEHTGSKDFLGPFAVQHRATDSTISFGTYRLQKLKVPSGAELMAALEEHRARLEREAKKGWEEFMAAALSAQGRLAASDLVAWPKLVAEVMPDPKVRRKAGKALLFRLSMLLSEQAPGGRRIDIAPPALGEQKHAVTVPRLNRANDDVRIYRIRIS